MVVFEIRTFRLPGPGQCFVAEFGFKDVISGIAIWIEQLAAAWQQEATAGGAQHQSLRLE